MAHKQASSITYCLWLLSCSQSSVWLWEQRRWLLKPTVLIPTDLLCKRVEMKCIREMTAVKSEVDASRNWFLRKAEVKISLGAIAWATYRKTTSLTVVSLRWWYLWRKVRNGVFGRKQLTQRLRWEPRELARSKGCPDGQNNGEHHMLAKHFRLSLLAFRADSQEWTGEQVTIANEGSPFEIFTQGTVRYRRSLEDVRDFPEKGDWVGSFM